MTTAPCTLLTGATGLIGGDWLRAMVSRGGERTFLVLTRSPELFLGWQLVQALGCDLTDGAIPIAEEYLARVTEIVHCAADIRFGISLELARAANVEGTRRMLDVARRCPRLRKFAHVSSVYAAGKLEGDFAERRFPPHAAFFNSYQQSKYEAEELVLDESRVPAAIFRLSSVIGNSRGEVQQFNYFHQLLKMIPNSGPVPMMPGNPLAPVDLIPSDWAVAALDHLVEHSFEAGRIYHDCAGPSGSLAVRTLVDRAFHKFAMRPPRLVSRSDFERFAAEWTNGRSGVVGEMLRVLDRFLPHLALYQSFDNGRTRADLERAGIRMPAIESFYERIIDYCVLTNWGKSPSTLAAADRSVDAAQRMRRDAEPIEDLHARPASESPGEAAPLETAG